MKPGAGKEKGSGYERDIAVELSKWLTHGVKTDVITRSQGSGARFTSVGKGCAGDLMATDPVAFPLCGKLLIECKSWQWIDFLDFSFKMGTDASWQLYAAWEKARKQAEGLNICWSLIFRQNRRNNMIMLPHKLFGNALYSFPLFPTAHIFWHNTYDSVCLFQLWEFLEKVPPEKFICLLEEWKP